ncbi:hypothetical protein EAH87_14410 [Sphingomonas koreensis]|nr:hypothetical protein EAH87_14410 [Sphingomonas koreensis]
MGQRDVPDNLALPKIDHRDFVAVPDIIIKKSLTINDREFGFPLQTDRCRDPVGFGIDDR